MTVKNEAELRTLIETIVRTIEEQLLLARQKILAVCCNDSNRDKTLRTAEAINGHAEFSSEAGLDALLASGVKPDVLFIDYIPLEKAADLALGLCTTTLGRIVNDCLVRNKKIFIIKKAPGSETLKGAYRDLFVRHWTAIASYGVSFLNIKDEAEKKGETGNKSEKKFIYRSDVEENVSGGKLFVAKDALITKSARVAAKEKGIEIIRM